MKLKRVIRERERTTLAVDRVIHTLVKLYAKKQGVSVAEATCVLLAKALADGLEIKASNE